MRKVLRTPFPWGTSQNYDGSLLDTLHVDQTLTLIDCTNHYQSDAGRLRRHLEHNEYIEWAIDPHIFYPEKTDKLRILIVLANYASGVADYSHVTINSLSSLTIPYEARTLGNSGL